MGSPMPQPIARFLVLRDSRRLPLAVALALALGNCVASGDLVMPFPRIRMPMGYRHVLVVDPDSARKPHVETFLAWLAEQFEQAPRLER